MPSMSFRQKAIVYISLSYIFAVMLLATAVVDYVSTMELENPNALPSSWPVSLLLLHTVSVYLILLGFIYSSEIGDPLLRSVSTVSIILNLAAFVLRVAYHQVFIDYRPANFVSG